MKTGIADVSRNDGGNKRQRIKRETNNFGTSSKTFPFFDIFLTDWRTTSVPFFFSISVLPPFLVIPTRDDDLADFNQNDLTFLVQIYIFAGTI